MRPLIIINHAAAKARAAWPVVRAKLEAAGLAFDFHETTGPGDATVKTRDALKAGVVLIVVIGGDGTLSEAAQGFFQFNERLEQLPSPINPAAQLAILPAGTGDDFARSLVGRREPLNSWIETFISYCQTPADENVRSVDVFYGLCNGYQSPFICLNASTMGIGGETAARVAAQGSVMRRFSGELRFAMAALAALAGWRERRVRISVDDQQIIDGRMNLVAVANALYAGGGMMLSPEAKFSDGLLDVVTASGLNRLEIVRELARIHKGGHVANLKVRVVQGERVAIETFSAEDALPIEADGNVRGVTPVSFQVMPGVLRFVIGKK